VAIGSVYNRFARLIFRIRIRDIDCDFRLIRRAPPRRDAALLDQRNDLRGAGAQLEMSSCRVAEVGVRHYPRLHGRSQFFRLRSLLTTLYDLLACICTWS